MGSMNRKIRIRNAALFKFQTFSPRQKMVLSWWTEGSPYKDMNGIIADGSIRSGKTLSMSMSFTMWAMETFDECNFALCGKSIGALRRNVIHDLQRILKSRGYLVDYKRGLNMMVVAKGSHLNYFYMFGGRDERSQDYIQGITLAGAFFDEVALMPESFVNQATARCSVEGAKLWFNCNPDSKLHWFKVNWINKFKEKKLVYLHFTMDDNLSLSEETKERYRSMYIGMFYKRYILGLWVSADGLIYDMWDDKENTFDLKNIHPGYKDDWKHYVAIDYGTTNPFAALDVWDDDTTMWITKELYWDSKEKQRQKTDAEYADDLEAFIEYDKGVVLIVDPSAASFQVEMKKRGYIVKDADNDVSDGIRRTATMINKRRLKVEKNCKYFLRERDTYIWDEKAVKIGKEAPVKQRDHAMDAARYLVKTIVKNWRLAA
jgi:PBSX family phage terminase large subunit